MDIDIDALLGKLSLEQKARLVTGADFWTLHPEPTVGLRAVAVSDGPVGVRGTVDDERDTSANLPSPTALAASWDTDLLARLAGLLAAEARRKGVDAVLGPTINLHRSPLGGRHFECYSEDPLLTARLGTAYVRAMQARGVGATPKHYVANDSETERFTLDARLDERSLRELYLRPFEDIVRDADPWLVMAAYNGVNGHTMTESPLLAEPLKGEWGFSGVVVSDWLATRDTVAAGNAALDLAMPALNSPWADGALLAAVRAGTVSEQALDAKVRRILVLAARVGALEGAPSAQTVAAPDIPALLREAAAAGSVLLANPSGVLPLDARALRRVAVLGPNAVQARTQGGGSATVHPAYTVSPLDGLRAALPGVELVHVAGARVVSGLQTVDWEVATDPESGRSGTRHEVLAADGSVLDGQHRRAGRVTDLRLGAEAATAVRIRCRLRADEPGEWQFGFTGVGAYRLAVNGETVLDGTLVPDLGVEVTSVFADPPQQKVARMLAAGEEVDLALTYDVFPDMPMLLAALGYERPALDAEAELARAAGAARGADAVIVVVGTTNKVESEGFDRTGLALPGRQDDLVRAAAAANPRTVVVVNAGSPVLMPWRDEVAAVLLSWFGGQEMGNALADVLLGAAEPGGRLPTTWPVRLEDVPVLDTTPVQGVLAYAEGIHIGYRAWLRAGTTPAYPFGHGLGYTTWAYEELAVSGAVASVRLRNTGTRVGKEVVQVYLSRPDSAVERPVRWLAGFAVVRAEPGEPVTVEVPLDPRVFQHWSVDAHAWTGEPGVFELYAGRSVTDTPLRGEVLRC
ncbi:MAG TPA: glycoside hydrolase family 3 C-terminal domain-containing protein [Rugosimonospora sp.]|nr:glycoside hydrolase family 3 C-terminal domain-containing protein [Rugosimonospora sp.]